MKKPTALEKLTDNVITQGGLAAIAASAGTPLAALLTVLTGTLAAGRYRKRLDATLEEFELILKTHQHRLDALTDSQFKLMNEIVLATVQNTEDAKIGYLRRAMISGLENSEISHTIASQVSRALRDMTAGELEFVLTHSGRPIMIGPISGNVDPSITVIDRNSDDMIYVSGLMGLGVLNPIGSTMDDGGIYGFAKFCETLKTFIEES